MVLGSAASTASILLYVSPACRSAHNLMSASFSAKQSLILRTMILPGFNFMYYQNNGLHLSRPVINHFALLSFDAFTNAPFIELSVLQINIVYSTLYSLLEEKGSH